MSFKLPGRFADAGATAARDDVEKALRGVQETAEAFEATNPSDWTGDPPTTLAEAINRLAAATPGA